jgi:F0F1-type ATP synthase membrane subunit b/b'
MAENNQESQGPEVDLQSAATPREGDRQSLLLKLAERTVLQAETLAQEITDRARQESEVEGTKLLEQYRDQAKEEAQQALEIAQRQSETLLNEATARALAESEQILNKAQSESEKMLKEARSQSEAILGNARSESEQSLDSAQTEGQEILSNAQVEVREILGRVQQEALAIIHASQARADSTESKARLQAEFIIRQTTQNVANGIRSAVLETCNNLLPALDELGKETPEAIGSDPAAAIEAKLPTTAASDETENDSSPPAPANTDIQSSNKPSGRKARSSTKP